MKSVSGAWKWALSGAAVGVLVMCMTLASALFGRDGNALLAAPFEFHPITLPATPIFTIVFQRDLFEVSGIFRFVFPVFLVTVNTAIYTGFGYGLWWARSGGRRRYVWVSGALIALWVGSLGGAALMGLGFFHADGIWNRVGTENFSYEDWEKTEIGRTLNAEFVEHVGEPTCRRQIGDREFLVYRTLTHSTSGDYYFSFPVRKYYTTYEYIYFAVFEKGVAVKLDQSEKRYSLPAEEVEFSCDWTLFFRQFVRSPMPGHTK